MIGYLIGREYGYWLLLRYGNYIRMSKGRIKLGQYLFLSHGGKIVFFAQFVPVLRTVARLFAGCNVMPWRNFLIANIAGSALWAITYGYGAYALGLGIEQLEGPIAIVLALLTIVSFISAAFSSIGTKPCSPARPSEPCPARSSCRERRWKSLPRRSCCWVGAKLRRPAGRSMKMLAEYLDMAMKFERMAANENNPTLKKEFERQAAGFRKLAEKRAEEYGLTMPRN